MVRSDIQPIIEAVEGLAQCDQIDDITETIDMAIALLSDLKDKAYSVYFDQAIAARTTHPSNLANYNPTGEKS